VVEKKSPATCDGRALKANSKKLYAPYGAFAEQSQQPKKYGVCVFENADAAHAWGAKLAEDATEFVNVRRRRRRCR
jgi:hypothetical protein